MSASLPIYDIRGSKIHKYMSASQADYEIRWLHLPRHLTSAMKQTVERLW
jgi:hypothetical protein